MKVTRQQAEINRVRVVKTAAQLVRERGFAGVGVADVMQAAGLTHGGFYAQFDSKQHLMAEAFAQALEESELRWHEALERAPKRPLPAIAVSDIRMIIMTANGVDGGQLVSAPERAPPACQRL